VYISQFIWLWFYICKASQEITSNLFCVPFLTRLIPWVSLCSHNLNEIPLIPDLPHLLRSFFGSAWSYFRHIHCRSEQINERLFFISAVPDYHILAKINTCYDPSDSRSYIRSDNSFFYNQNKLVIHIKYSLYFYLDSGIKKVHKQSKEQNSFVLFWSSFLQFLQFIVPIQNKQTVC